MRALGAGHNDDIGEYGDAHLANMALKSLTWDSQHCHRESACFLHEKDMYANQGFLPFTLLPDVHSFVAQCEGR